MAKLQMSMFAPKSEWIPPIELPDITSAKKIAIDVETKDPNLKSNGPGWPTGDGEVVGYAIAVDEWSGYIPIRHFGGGNLDEKIVNRWLKKVFECPADKIMHNAQYDLGWIKAMGFDVKGRIIDTEARRKKGQQGRRGNNRMHPDNRAGPDNHRQGKKHKLNIGYAAKQPRQHRCHIIGLAS